MNRLVQGDVGAGKTVVALRAMLQVVDNGRQAAMLAPTEVLAAQHAPVAAVAARAARAGGGAGRGRAGHPASRCCRGRCPPRRSGRRCWRRQSGRGRDRRRHARPDPGPGRVRRAGPGGGRRAAPVRRRAARRAARARRARSAPAGDDGHPDPAHGGDDGVRRPRGRPRCASCPAAVRRSRPRSCRQARSRRGWSGCGGGSARRSRPATRCTWCARGWAATPARTKSCPTTRTPVSTQPAPEGTSGGAPLAVLEVAPKLAEGPLRACGSACCTASCRPTRRTP